MNHEYEKTRRHAENTLAEVNRHLDKGTIKNPRHHQMLIDMAEKAMRTMNHLDRMERRQPYSDTDIGYTADVRQRQRTSDDLVDDMMDAINRVLPQIADDVDARRYSRRGRVRADDRYDDDLDDDLDDREVVNMPRWRSARTGRFLPNLYGPSRTRRVRRRSDADDRYDDDRYDDIDDIRRTADEARRMADDARRTADDARRPADDARYTPPTMRTDHYPRTDDRRMDDDRYSRTDDADDRTRKPGPDMRR